MSETDVEASAEAFSILVWRQTSVKTIDFFLRDFTRATHLSIISIFPHTLSFAIFYHVFQNHSGCLSTTL